MYLYLQLFQSLYLVLKSGWTFTFSHIRTGSIPINPAHFASKFSDNNEQSINQKHRSPLETISKVYNFQTSPNCLIHPPKKRERKNTTPLGKLSVLSKLTNVCIKIWHKSNFLYWALVKNWRMHEVWSDFGENKVHFRGYKEQCHDCGKIQRGES